METQMDDVTVTVARAIYAANADQAGMMDTSWETGLVEQPLAVEFARERAYEVLAALDLPAIKAAARREAFEEAARLADARAEYYAMSGHPDRFACSEIAAAIRELAATNERTNND
jgi:hypothetical protein